ncbi:unnamed protein product [Closterium sp. NIES-65]|nr:unnamed protein product [Closterium sp. NIES-65]
MARDARALSDPIGCLKKFDVAVEAGGATVVLAAEDKSVLADDSADFTAAVLDFAYMHAVEARQEESDDEKYEEAEGDQETEGAGEGDGDGKDGEQRDRNREAADRTLRRLEDTMVGLKALIADSISDAVARTRYEMAPWGRMGTFEAGVATAADRGGGGIRMVTGPLRFETTEATGSEDRGVKRPSGLPTSRSPSPPPKKAKGSSEQPEAQEPGRGSLAQKSKAAGATVKRPSPIPSGTGGPPAAGGAATQQAGVPLLHGTEKIPDADAKATEAMQKWLSMVQHPEKADAKGSAKGKEKEDPKWGIGIRRNSRGLFTSELHHSSRWYFGSHAKLPTVRFLCAVAIDGVESADYRGQAGSD